IGGEPKRFRRVVRTLQGASIHSESRPEEARGSLTSDSPGRRSPSRLLAYLCAHGRLAAPPVGPVYRVGGSAAKAWVRAGSYRLAIGGAWARRSKRALACATPSSRLKSREKDSSTPSRFLQDLITPLLLCL